MRLYDLVGCKPSRLESRARTTNKREDCSYRHEAITISANATCSEVPGKRGYCLVHTTFFGASIPRKRLGSHGARCLFSCGFGLGVPLIIVVNIHSVLVPRNSANESILPMAGLVSILLSPRQLILIEVKTELKIGCIAPQIPRAYTKTPRYDGNNHIAGTRQTHSHDTRSKGVPHNQIPREQNKNRRRIAPSRQPHDYSQPRAKKNKKTLPPHNNTCCTNEVLQAPQTQQRQKLVTDAEVDPAACHMSTSICTCLAKRRRE